MKIIIYLKYIPVKTQIYSINYACSDILISWFRASLIYINYCPTRWNTKRSIYYSASSLYMFRVSNTPIIRSTQNCNYSHQYCAAAPLHRGKASFATLEGGSCTVPEAVVTVLCTPDNGCDWHPKHVEWTCRIINTLLCFAIIEIDQLHVSTQKSLSG